MSKPFPYKFGYIELSSKRKVVQKLAVYISRFGVWFMFKARRIYITYPTARKGFTDEYMHEMKYKFFPKKYVEEQRPVVATGSSGKIKFNIKFPIYL